MIIYNVTIKILKAREQEWVKWMMEEHMPELMKTGCFEAYHLHNLIQDIEDTEDDGVTYVAQYHCKSLKEYETYINEHASKMRQAGFDRFGNSFIAFRTLMKQLV